MSSSDYSEYSFDESDSDSDIGFEAEMHYDDRNLGDIGIIDLAGYMVANPKLESLFLSENKIGDVGAGVIASVVSRNPKIDYVSVPVNHISDEGARSLADVLHTNTSLEYLDLTDNRIGPVGAKYIAEALAENTAMVHFHMSENPIEDRGARAFARALQGNTSMDVLHLNEIRIGDSGGAAIGRAFCMGNLTELYLENNIIGNAGARGIAEGISKSKSIEILSLSTNMIGGKGAEYIANALRSCPSLKTLNLGHNKIGDRGARALAAALPEIKALEELWLEGNGIGNEGASYIFAGVSQNFSIQNMSLSGRHIDDGAIMTATKFVPRICMLYSVSMYGLPIGNDAYNALYHAMDCTNNNSLNVRVRYPPRDIDHLGGITVSADSEDYPDTRTLADHTFDSMGGISRKVDDIKADSFESLRICRVGFPSIDAVNTFIDGISDASSLKAITIVSLNLK